MKPPRRKPRGCSPVERAIIAQQWDDAPYYIEDDYLEVL